jgi:hypothetical protein
MKDQLYYRNNAVPQQCHEKQLLRNEDANDVKIKFKKKTTNNH